MPAFPAVWSGEYNVHGSFEFGDRCLVETMSLGEETAEVVLHVGELISKDILHLQAIWERRSAEASWKR